ncbi:MAG: PEP-CTERM sorting domain-containing protein [Burkholderiaceae bacterium]
MSAYTASAAVVTLTFEGAGNLARLERYYNGGTDSQGHAGPNLGVAFGSTARSIIDEDVPSVDGSLHTGNFGNEPSPDTVLFFLDGPAAVLNVADGFRDGFSFYYSSTTYAGIVSVFAQSDAGGSLLGTIALSPLGVGQGDPTGSYNRWLAAGLSFEGVARSVAFGGTGDRIAFDNVTFGSATPGAPLSPIQTVAEPSTLALLGLGLLAAGVWARRRT